MLRVPGGVDADADVFLLQNMGALVTALNDNGGNSGVIYLSLEHDVVGTMKEGEVVF